MSVNSCTIPSERKDIDGDGRWLAMHEQFIQQGKQKDAESEKFSNFPHANFIKKNSFSVLFIGDDILNGEE